MNLPAIILHSTFFLFLKTEHYQMYAIVFFQIIDTPGHARGPNCITASVEADLNPGALGTRHNF